ncbi:MAG: 5-formyltetrahydrofolate cyclo-ligase [Proteobacteria bacterium]|nr:5-formyltetrahydrofolate cyclo-ligase [Pseudomonadota bacterium]
MTSSPIQKQRQRQDAHSVRNSLQDADAGKAAARNFQAKFKKLSTETVSLYWPIGSELDTRPLLHSLYDSGVTCVLPVIEAKDNPLFFRRWQPELTLVPGPFKVPVPPETEDILVPTVIVAPLLAFDRHGFRLGYGGGYYDRTLEKLRQTSNCTAVGYAYAGQEVTKIVTDEFDQKLDWVVTEIDVRKFG